MMPFGDWSWRVMIMRSAFEDAWQGPRMVFAVGRSVDARAGCAVTALRSLLFSSGISFFSSYVSDSEHANIRSTKSYAQTYITAQPCTQSLSSALSSLSLTRARAVPPILTDAILSSPAAQREHEHMRGLRRRLERDKLSLSPRAAPRCARCARW